MERLKVIVNRDNTAGDDTERLALFYIIASNSELYESIEEIYNFKTRSILLSRNEENYSEWSSGAQALLKLAFHLYNPAICKYPINEIFKSLDQENTTTAIKAIRLKYNDIDEALIQEIIR